MRIIRPTARVYAGRLDPVPLINVVFLLLIFFLISSSLVFQPGIPVDLPPAVNPNMNVTDTLLVTINRNGVLYFNDKRVEWAELERELRELVLDSKVAAANRAGTRITGFGDKTVRNPALILRADRNVPYDRIMQVISLARSLNLGVYMATALQTGGPKTPKIME